MPARSEEETIYPDLIGPLGRRSKVWAALQFVDPIADVAVLGEPDGQNWPEEAEAYKELTDAAQPLAIARLPLTHKPLARSLPSGEKVELLGPPQAQTRGWMLALDGHWFSCDVHAFERSLWIRNATSDIASGMSGSPILDDDGAALGIVSVSGSREGGPNPFLARNLPGWLLDDAWASGPLG
jgi:hypothetical protein